VPTVGARPCHRPEECQLALGGRRRARSAQHLAAPPIQMLTSARLIYMIGKSK